MKSSPSINIAADAFPKLGEKAILHFRTALPGLEPYQHYNMEKLPESDHFILIQAIDEQQVALILVKSHFFYPDYSVKISSNDLEELGTEDVAEILIFNTVTVVEEDFFVNLAAPILINPYKHLGKQIILADMQEMLRTPLEIFPNSISSSEGRG